MSLLIPSKTNSLKSLLFPDDLDRTRYSSSIHLFLKHLSQRPQPKPWQFVSIITSQKWHAELNKWCPTDCSVFLSLFYDDDAALKTWQAGNNGLAQYITEKSPWLYQDPQRNMLRNISSTLTCATELQR
ncbi:uncharacterized protein LOC110006586 [Amborella trichopoda]|uniref:uncharacterized protein LOC110006586 n=1 Tax=Amborella trichopoda TaxID=13333 RepID=UPI0009BFA408|nr:uncharacterized protein LOC110006586 [Amborella trichopoda]|eukprot:XP_020518172.1 uncharacterized protein LOC110006586 [Amborella trichopoda]